MPDQTIPLSAGAVEYTLPRTISSSTDLTGDTVDVSLGTFDAPGAWVSPDVRTTSSAGGVFTVTVKLLIGTTLRPGAGDYWLWVRLHDAPEVLPERTPGRIRIIA